MMPKLNLTKPGTIFPSRSTLAVLHGRGDEIVLTNDDGEHPSTHDNLFQETSNNSQENNLLFLPHESSLSLPPSLLHSFHG